MIMAVTCIVMLVIRLDRFLGPALIATLAKGIGWIDTDDEQNGRQKANRSHGSAPFPGDGINRLPTRLLKTRKNR